MDDIHDFDGIRNSEDAGLNIGGQRWPAVLLLTIAPIYLGGLFQVGYFRFIGIEFLSLMAAQDWAIAIGLSIVPVLTAWYPLVLLYQYIQKKHHLGKLDDNMLLGAANKFLSPVWNLIIVVAAVCILVFLGSLDSFWFVVLLGVLAFVVVIMSMVVQLIDIYAFHHAITMQDFLLLCLLSGSASYNFGYFYAMHLAGRSCEVFESDGHSESSLYLRSVGGGHLMRGGGRVRFIPSDRVVEISCGP